MCLAAGERIDETASCMHEHVQRGHFASTSRSGSRSAVSQIQASSSGPACCAAWSCRLCERVRCMQSGPAAATSCRCAASAFLLQAATTCSCAGLASEAVALLQEGHLWRYASTLAAHRLRGEQQAAALERWAAHIHQVGPDCQVLLWVASSGWLPTATREGPTGMCCVSPAASWV